MVSSRQPQALAAFFIPCLDESSDGISLGFSAAEMRAVSLNCHRSIIKMKEISPKLLLKLK
jgi:hypothetical protein